MHDPVPEGGGQHRGGHGAEQHGARTRPRRRQSGQSSACASPRIALGGGRTGRARAGGAAQFVGERG
ncbi:hypothetical protein BJF79_19925 [Actinomadura sp. CNU-125]|nr:hypothetical protein BJF79_19925 [Actinomadura sp. CNU-125]